MAYRIGDRFAIYRGASMNGMMDGGMMWGMGLFGILGIVVLVLLVAALVKYLFFSRNRRD
jgi:uncharacterized membrane protein